MHTFQRLLACAAALAFSLIAVAQDYPAKPIRVVVPFGAGGGTDIMTRLITEEMAKGLGRSVVVENRPGGGTVIGAEAVAKSPADGYTLLSTSSATYAINPTLYEKLSYDPITDFAPIAFTGRFTVAVIVNNDFPAKTLKELVAMAKAKPGTIAYSSPGPTSGTRLGMELFADHVGMQLSHIPYKGQAQADQDVAAGHVPVGISNPGNAMPHLKSGRVRMLAIATAKRWPTVPEVPTFDEAGFPGIEAGVWQAMVAPAGTPQPIVQRLNREIVKAVSDPEVQRKFIAAGVEPLDRGTPEEVAAHMKKEVLKWRAVLQKAKIKAE
jgi:tripartite-type tricarboxylate transporter receptor subunit TctC